MTTYTNNLKPSCLSFLIHYVKEEPEKQDILSVLCEVHVVDRRGIVMLSVHNMLNYYNMSLFYGFESDVLVLFLSSALTSVRI